MALDLLVEALNQVVALGFLRVLWREATADLATTMALAITTALTNLAAGSTPYRTYQLNGRLTG